MIPRGVEIFVGLEPIDLRWGFDRLAGAVAWGRAACLQPGSTVPGPEETEACAVAVRVVADPDPLQAVKDVAS